MKPLTLKYALDNKFNAIDCIKYYRPHWDDRRCNDFLWASTCFPFDNNEMIRQINKQFLPKAKKYN